MIWILPRTLLVIFATATTLPAGVTAEPPAAVRAGDPPLDALAPQEREVLDAAGQLATEAAQQIEQWIMIRGKHWGCVRLGCRRSE